MRKKAIICGLNKESLSFIKHQSVAEAQVLSSILIFTLPNADNSFNKLCDVDANLFFNWLTGNRGPTRELLVSCYLQEGEGKKIMLAIPRQLCLTFGTNNNKN